MNPRLIVEQKITPFANQYAIFSADSAGTKVDLLAFAHQKRLAFKEKVTFYSDESKQKEVFSFRAEKVMDIHGKFLVEDPEGNQIGAFKKEFKKSLLNSTWNTLDKNDGPELTVSESNQALAIIRRIAGFIPIIGDLIDLIVAFLRYHFVVAETETNKEVGRYQKTTLFRDHYLLSMDEDAYKAHDWRVLASMAVALDALQGR